MTPDFGLYGRAFGAEVFTIAEDGEVDDTIAAALQAEGPALVHVRTSRDHIAPDVRLSTLRTA